MSETFVVYFSIKGSDPINDFLDSLTEKQQAKILRVLQTIKTYGIFSVMPHVKKLTGLKIWEIRILGKDNIRIIYFIFDKQTIVLLHGFIKKSQKMSQKDISIAVNRFNVWKSLHAK